MAKLGREVYEQELLRLQTELVKLPARPPSSGYQRTARALQREVPDHAAKLA